MPLRGGGHRLDEPLDDGVGVDALGFGVEVGDEPMPQHRSREGADVLHRHVVAPVHQGAGLAAEDEGLRGADAGPPADPLLHEVRRAGAARPGGVDQAHRVARHLVGDDHLPDEVLEVQDVLAGEHAARPHRLVRRRGGHHLHLVVLGQVGHDDVEHEARELRLRQRVGSLELDRVLRREHEERPLERVRAAARGDVVLLHRLEQGRLRLGRRAVDLVGQDDLREDRSADERELAVPARLLDDLGAGDVGRHQVRRELDPLEREVQHLGQGAHEQGLRQTRNARDQAVPAAHERRQHEVDRLVLADDHLAQLAQDAGTARQDPLGRGGRPRRRLRHHPGQPNRRLAAPPASG